MFPLPQPDLAVEQVKALPTVQSLGCDIAVDSRQGQSIGITWSPAGISQAEQQYGCVIFKVSAPLTYIEFVVHKPADGMIAKSAAGTVRSGQVTEDCSWDRFNQVKVGLPKVVPDNSGENKFTTEEPVGVLYNAVARTTTTFKNGVVISTSGAQSDAPCAIFFNVNTHPSWSQACTARATAKPPPPSYAAFQ
jgi:hypothetical protein